MYKIYINETPLNLKQIATGEAPPASGSDGLVARYPGRSKFLLQYVDLLEKTQRYESVTLYHTDLEVLWADFRSLFVEIEAAGGLVFNAAGEVLAIYRRGVWDLPKGKIDPGETPEIAAVREVREETGLHEPLLGRFLHRTFHTYRDKKLGRVLKKTYWYQMHTSEHDLQPQTEEDIEQAIWLPLPDLLSRRPIYSNILDVAQQLNSGKFEI